MVLEHLLHRLQVELGGHVAHAAVFVVEILGRLRAFVVADGEVFEHLVMADHVIAEVHAHEPGQLHEAGIDPPARAAILHRHGGDDIVAEPLDRAVHRQIVDAGRRTARVDRPAHHGQRARRARMAIAVHDRSGGKDGHRRLAHRHHMRTAALCIGADVFEIADHVIDVIIEIEGPFVQRDSLRIGPVRDIDAVALQHPFDRAAQQRGVMPAHRRDDQQARGVFGQVFAVECLQITEGPVDHSRFDDRHGLAIDIDRLEVPRRLAVGCRRMREDFQRARCHRADVHIAHRAEVIERIGRVVQHFHPDRGEGAGRVEPAALQFIGVVEQ